MKRLLYGCFEVARAAAVRMRLPYQVNFLWKLFSPEGEAIFGVAGPVPPGGASFRRILVVGQQETGSTGRSRLQALRSLMPQTRAVNLSVYTQGLSLWRQFQTNH